MPSSKGNLVNTNVLALGPDEIFGIKIRELVFVLSIPANLWVPLDASCFSWYKFNFFKNTTPVDDLTRKIPRLVNTMQTVP